MTQVDYYRLLGVSRNASAADIRAAYARLIKRHHPDVVGPVDPMTQRLHDYQRAYRCLSDIATRAAHDRALLSEDRLHALRQQRLQDRLRRYDRRHPRNAPKRRRYARRRRVLLVIAGVVLMGGMSALLLV